MQALKTQHEAILTQLQDDHTKALQKAEIKAKTDAENARGELEVFYCYIFLRRKRNKTKKKRKLI